MKKGSLLKKCLSWIMAFAILLGVAAPASAAVSTLSEETYGYVAIGDAMTAGIGLNDPETEAYFVKVAQYLGTESTSVADRRYRIEEIRYLLDDEYAGDGYTASIGGLNTDRKAGTLKNYVKNADVISLNVGVNNFSTYIVNQMVHYLENGGAVKYAYSFDAFGDSQVQDAMENVKAVVKDRLLAAAPDQLDDAIELIDFVAEVGTYAYLSYVTSFNAVVSEIYALNPDVDLYVVGIYNAMEGDVLTVDAGSHTVEVPIGEAFGALVELGNVYTQILAPRAFDYIYVDPGTPELLIDVMGNTALAPENRIPSALKLELLNSVEDTAISMIQEMFMEYGVAKSDDEAFAIAEEIFEKNSADRREYIKSLIQEFAVEEVITRFQEELQDVADTYGSITVTNDDIIELLNNLEAATTENERREEATEFVVDLMTKAMVGQTFAGVEIKTQADAYEAIDRLERNSHGDPNALREAAADMIYAKVGENGLKDFITRDDVLYLLEQLDTTTSDAQREVIIDEWMNDLAVKKIAAKIQTIKPSYKEADAKALLAAMAGAPEADREAIAKNHLLTTGGFHKYMVSKFTETYETNGLTLQTYPTFDAFVTAVETAPNNDAAKAIVRTEIRQAAAAKVVADPTCQNLMPSLTQNEIIELFGGMDSAADAGNYLFSWICEYFNTPNPNDLQIELIINPMKNVFMSAYNAYNNAATAAENAFAEYRDGVDTAAEGFAQYVSLKDTAAQQILDAYNQQYQGAGETALKYYADYLQLRDQAVAKVLNGYDEYERAINLGLDTVDQFNETFDKVFDQLRKIAEVEKISLNHLVAVAKKLDANYVQSMIENLVQGDPLASEDKTVAYIALRYYLANAMMIMPSAGGHNTIANQIIKAIETGKSVNSAAGELANKVINKGLDIYHCAKEFLSLPTGASGQVGTLVNPNTYVAFGDNVTSGTALKDSSLAYPQLIGNALAMDYVNSDMDETDDVFNYALNGMRAEELLMLLSSSYSGDAYTEARFGKDYIESLRAQYIENVKKADLITINVGINNLTTFPIQQTLLAFNGEETYEMDWARYIGQSRYEKINKGKNAVMNLLLGIVDNAESRKPVLDDLNAYEKAERALETTFTAIESLLYGLIGYAVNLDDAVETAAALNPNATIVLIGFYNPLEGTYFNVDRTVELKGHEFDLSKYTINVSALTDKVINIANRFLTNYVGDIAGDGTAADKGSRIVSVPILDTTLGVSDTGASKDLSTLTAVKTFNVKGHEIDLLVPEYFAEAGKNVGVNLHPNATGHAYIASKVLNALRFEINATVWLQDSWKYYGDADPDFTYLIDDLSSLYDAIDVKISREAGEEIGHYEINATVTYKGYKSVTVKVADFEIMARPVTVTVEPAYREIEKGDEIPEYKAVVTDEDGNVIEGLNPVISGVPADSNTIGTYTIKAELNTYGYEAVAYNYATLVIGEKTKTPINIQVVLSDDTIEYGDNLPTASVVVTDKNGNPIDGVDVTVIGMPAANCGHGTYTISAQLNDTENYVVSSVTNATLTVAPRAVTITITPANTEIEVGGTIPQYSAVVTDTHGNVIDIEPDILGVPSNSNTVGTYTITADLDDEDYDVIDVIDATLVIKDNANANAKITTNMVTLTLKGQVFIEYCVNLTGFADNIDFTEAGGVVIWTGSAAPTNKEQLQVGAANCVWKDGSMYYSDVLNQWTVTSNGINAKEYGDLVYMRAYVEISEGNYIYGPAIYYSPEMYCKNKISQSPDVALKEVCASMLAYGSAAQQYFNYKTDKLVDTGMDLNPYNLTYSETMLDSMDAPTADKANTLSGERHTGIPRPTVTLSLKAAIVLEFVYQIDVENIDTVELLVWNEEDYNSAATLAYDANTYSYSIPMVEGSLIGIDGYVASSEPIPAKEIGDTLYFCVRVVTTDGSVYRGGLGYYSPDEYVRSKDDGADAKLAAVVQALAVYSEKARVVFDYKLNENQ